MRRFPALVVLALLVAAVIACSKDKPTETPTPDTTAGASTPTPSGSTTPNTSLTWRSCGGLECSTISVPLDYANPNGHHITLDLIRRRATSESSRIGSLLVNFGGPGASGVDFFPNWIFAVPSEIKNAFDLVSFDPRGVDQLHCGVDVQAFAALNPLPDTQDEWTQVDKGSTDYAAKCAQNSDGILPYLGTVNAARDLDQIRIALGDDKLTYLGYSYGTSLGSVYASLFPDKVRALVLDGVVDTTLSADDSTSQQAQGFQGALNHFIADCKARRCIETFPNDPLAAIQEIIRRADASPIPSLRADRPAGAGEAVLGVISALYSESNWSELRSALNDALDGDGSGLVDLTDDYLLRKPDGSYPNLFDVFYAVSCIDSSFVRDPLHYQVLAQEIMPFVPTFATNFAAGSLTCAHWSAPPQPLPPPTAHGAPPILLIGTTGDPATPYAEAVSMSKKIESAVLLTFNGEGHTAYGRPDSCVTSAVDTYLLTLKTPAPGTVCGDPSLSTPIPVNTTPLPTPVASRTP